MRKFVASSEMAKFPAFIELCQRFCDEQWVADHLDDEQAAESVLDQFRRVIRPRVSVARDSVCMLNANTEPARCFGVSSTSHLSSASSCAWR
jgi:hypothetical protein